MTPDLSQQTIGFIGGGNIATAIIGGLLNDTAPMPVQVSEPCATQRAKLARYPSVRCFDDNAACARACTLVVLAVKPQVMKTVLTGIADALATHKPLLISVAAGIRIADIQRWAGVRLPVVRVMPNTPALLNAGVSGVFAGQGVSEAQKQQVDAIMAAVGAVVWLRDESDLDIVTGISGSGPAYFLKLMEIMVAKATHAGLDPESARVLVLNTALGAARLALTNTTGLAELRRQVTSPKGTTEAALRRMHELGIDSIIESAIDAAVQRAAELAQELGDD